MRLPITTTALLALLAACGTSTTGAGRGRPAAPPPPPSPLDLPLGDPARRERRAPLTLDAITDTRTGELLGPAEIAARLALTRILFVGESHSDPAAHEAERRIVAALLATGRPVLVGLEMLPSSVQSALDDFTAGRTDEAAFLRAAAWYKHWGFNWGYYREIFLLARQHRAPLVGLNLPREIVSAVRMKGLAGLTAAESAQLPPRVDTSSAEHRRLFDAFFAAAGAHHGGHGALDPETATRFFEAQCTWDAAMGHAAVKALERHGDPDAILVVLIGSGHVAYGLGIARQAALWSSAPMASLVPVSVVDEAGAAPVVRASYADFLWGTPPEGPPPYPRLGVTLGDGEAGPVISSLLPDGPAAAAGVKTGDRVVAVDGATIGSRDDLLLRLGEARWGDVLRLELQRGAGRVSLRVPLRRSSIPRR